MREEWVAGTKAKQEALAFKALVEAARANNAILSASLMELRELAEEYGIKP
jgi:hypothetical protein